MGKKIRTAALVFLLLIALAAVVAAETPYRITYDLGEAAVCAQSVVNHNPDSFGENETVTLTEPECPGFRFVGWFAEPSCRTSVTEISGAGDITVYA